MLTNAVKYCSVEGQNFSVKPEFKRENNLKYTKDNDGKGGEGGGGV